MTAGVALVTGAQGFLGRHVVAELVGAGFTVVGVGRSPAQPAFTHRLTAPRSGRQVSAPLPLALAVSSDRYTYRRLDLADPQAVAALVAELEPAFVVHLAAALRDETWEALKNANVEATVVLVEALARMKSPPHLILGSSGAVYGTQKRMPVAEDVLPLPVGLYAASKLMGEIAATGLASHHGIPLCIARIFNLIGPGLQDRHLAARIAHDVARIEAGGLPPNIATSSLDATRDFVDVRDAARMITALSIHPTATGVVNVATGVETQVRDVARRLVDRAAVPIVLAETVVGDARPGADRQVADMTRAGALGLGASLTLDRSLDDLLQYARSVS